MAHQIYVTGLQWAVFVTSGIKNGKGYIIQTVRIKFTTEAMQEHAMKVEPRVCEIIGWMHKQELVQRGYLVDDDFPSWVTTGQRATLKSHYQLWAAHEKKVKEID